MTGSSYQRFVFPVVQQGMEYGMVLRVFSDDISNLRIFDKNVCRAATEIFKDIKIRILSKPLKEPIKCCHDSSNLFRNNIFKQKKINHVNDLQAR